jgi:hypothetical protein
LTVLLVLQAYLIEQIVYVADKLIQLANDSGIGVVFRSLPAGCIINASQGKYTGLFKNMTPASCVFIPASSVLEV